MSKSVIYAGNNTAQATTATGTTIAFNNIVRKYGCNCTLSGGNVTTSGSGYYEGTVNLTIEGTEAGTAVVTVYENGTAIPYATAETLTSAGSFNAVTVPFVIRNTCNCIDKVLTVVVSGVATSVINASIIVKKE